MEPEEVPNEVRMEQLLNIMVRDSGTMKESAEELQEVIDGIVQEYDIDSELEEQLVKVTSKIDQASTGMNNACKNIQQELSMYKDGQIN